MKKILVLVIILSSLLAGMYSLAEEEQVMDLYQQIMNSESISLTDAYAKANEINRQTLDDFILHEMDKGNRVTAINTRLRGIRVFIHFCAERDYAEELKYPLLKEDETVKAPYTDEELQRLLKRPTSNNWTEWRVWAAINTFLATGIRASTLLSIRIKDVDFEQNTILSSPDTSVFPEAKAG